MLNIFSGLSFGLSNRSKWGLVSINNEARIRYGVQTHFGLNWAAYANEAGVLDEIVSMGFDAFRDNVTWPKFETVAGVYTFNPTGDTYSRNVFAALAHNKAQGYNLHFTMGCQWGNGAYAAPSFPDPVWNDHFCDAYENMAQAYISAGYDPALLTMELWNEPTGLFSTIFDDAAEADDMAVLSQEFYARLKAVDSHITVTSPTVVDGWWILFGGVPNWIQNFWGTPGWTNIDAWSDHIYYAAPGVPLIARSPERMHWRALKYGNGFNNYLAAFALADGKAKLPIIISEYGFDTTTFTDAIAAKYFARALAVYSCIPNVQELDAYQLINTEDGSTFGLETSLGVRKLQGTAVAALLPHLKRATERRYYWTGGGSDNGYHAVLMETPSGQRLAVWSLEGNRTTTINVTAAAAGTLSVQIIGSTTSTQALAAGANTVSVNLTDTAIVLYADTFVIFPEFA